jgi:tRNA pseudouridine55 synthase
LEHWQGNELVFSVRCSKGTYVRTLAEDIGEALGCGAHLIGLRRTAIAPLKLEQAYTLGELNEMSDEQRDTCLLPVDTLLPDYPKLTLGAEQTRLIGQGRQLPVDSGWPEGMVRLYASTGFIGVGRCGAGRLAVERLTSHVARAAATAS